MKTKSFKERHASVLIVALLTITIMTLICATSLFITTQNAGSGMQTSGWQQAMTAAEAGVDQAVRALNATTSGSPAPWANWKVVPYVNAATYSLPSVEPTATATPAAAGTPDSSHYNYLPASQCTINFPNSEGATSVSAWVTVDKVGSSNLLSSGKQWYRVRSTGQTTYPSSSTILSRTSNNRLDGDLRNTIGMHFSRKGGSFLGPTRTIEVILQPVGGVSPWSQGALLQNSLSMSGGGVIDHFNSGTTSTTTFLGAPSTYRSTDYTGVLIGIDNANGSNLNNTYLYGGLSYSTTGSVPQNTKNVQGSVTSPFSETPAANSNPTWTPDITVSSAPANISPGTTNTSMANPYKVKVNGDFNVPGGNSVHINYPTGGVGTIYVAVWVTGNLVTSGSGYITQDNNVHVTYYVDAGVNVSGQSFLNGSGLAQNNQIFVVGSGDVTISGGGNLVGTIDAPNSNVTISGSGSLTGALIGNTLNISGGASLHYDDALAGYLGNGTVGFSSYAFASWFEDNSDPTHKDVNGNYIVY